MWSSIEPPTSRNSSTFTVLCRSGTIFRSSVPALLAVERIVSGRSSSVAGPWRGEAPPPPQRQLHAAGAEFDRIVQIAVVPLVPPLDGAAVAGFLLADA